MEPLSENNRVSKKGGCLPTSSSCVVWNGPDIPCIRLCTGDNIDEVIFKMATLLCEITDDVLNISELDLRCVLDVDDCPPETLMGVIQSIINKVCENSNGGGDTPKTVPELYLPLPECLYFTNVDGDVVTTLRQSEYVIYLATKICDLILEISNIQIVIQNILERVIIIESTITNLPTPSPAVTVTTQCLSLVRAPGETLTIGEAFSNLERNLCNYIATVGSVNELYDSLNSICIDDSEELPCGDGTYSSLPNWISNPQTLAGSVNNLWIAFCAFNECNKPTPEALPCIPLPVTSLVLQDPTVTGANIYWTAPALPSGMTLQDGYIINVYLDLGDCLRGDLITSYTQNDPAAISQMIIDPAITTNDTYVVDVIALYSCGESVATTVCGKLKEEYFIANFTFDDSFLREEPSACTALGKSDQIVQEITVSMLDPLGNPMINDTLENIEFVFSMLVTEGCPPATPITETLTVTIPPGQTFGSTTYVSEENVICEDEGDCQTLFREVSCLTSWTFSLNPTFKLDPTMPEFC